MPYDDLTILIPSHSLEDFPTEVGENEAASLLNAFAVPWHPALLAAARVLPRWCRADSPPEPTTRRLVLVPVSCDGWLPCGWAERLEQETGSVVVRGTSDRQEMLQRALAPLAGQFTVDPDLACDFLALGTCYLQMELLTRKMRHFSNLDEVHLQREAVAAAEAALAGDDTTARSHLRACFEVLTEARERFYPVECYLIDLCLLLPNQAGSHLLETLSSPKPVNLLATAADLNRVAGEQPEILSALREAWNRESVDLLAGEWNDAPTPLLPLNSVLWQFRTGTALIQKLFRRRPLVWGRRKFGLFPQLPQILKKFGYVAGLHVALDDGFYPDAEHTKLRWDGIDGSVVEGFSKIPLAADSATSYLRLPERMSESMDNDHVAAVAFARWPDVKAPWFDDLRRMHNYSAVLGRWITFSDFFQHTDNPGRQAAHKAHEYLSPFLFQAVARGESDPIGRFVQRFSRRQEFDTGKWYHGLRSLLRGQRLDASDSDELERRVEEVTDTAVAPEREALDRDLTAFKDRAANELAELVMGGSGSQPGYLLFNPLPFRRTVSVPIGQGDPPPDTAGQASAKLQWSGDQRWLTAEVPSAGFVWFPAGNASSAGVASGNRSSQPLAEEDVLRNEFFEVYLNPQTGGIRQLKEFGRSPNRLSQQLTYRFSRERVISAKEGEQREEVRTHYAEMRRSSTEVLCAGPSLGEVRTTGEIVDQEHGQRLAGFVQTMRVWKGRPILEIDIELDIDRQPDSEPWHNYYGCRFAWNNESVALTGSALSGAYALGEERCESPHYLEIADGDLRTTILPLGLPFHRKTGARMLDSLLVVAHETKRRFRFVIAIDQLFPMQAALEAMVPATLLRTTQGPPRSGTSGWFFHLDSRQVQVLDLLPLMSEPPAETDAWDRPDALPPAPSTSGFCLRLIETEGRSLRTKLRCFRQPVRARQRDFLGKTICDLHLEEDAVLVDLIGHEIADVEVFFE